MSDTEAMDGNGDEKMSVSERVWSASFCVHLVCNGDGEGGGLSE